MGMEESAVNEWTMMYQYFWKQLDFEYLLIDYPLERDSLEEILEILLDTCCFNRKLIRIAGDDKPKEVVKSRLMKLERDHIQYVMKCLDENSTKVRNMKQYVLATLDNAPLTISNFHKSWVNYDMANGLRSGEVAKAASFTYLHHTRLTFEWKSCIISMRMLNRGD